VASTGDGAIGPEVAALDIVLEQRGLTSYVFNELPAEADENRELNGGVSGVTFTSLAAAKNEQGRLSRSLGGSFVHVELDVDVRADWERRKLASSAIAAVIAKPPATEDLRQAAEDAMPVTLASAEVGPTPEVVEAKHEKPAGEPQIRVAAKPVRDGRKTRVDAVELKRDVTP
jgi:hypothetical protein